IVSELRAHGARADFVRADLSKPDDVRMLAARVRSEYDRLDVLINNAGARFDRYQETTEGIELTFATNHLGHFLLTALVAELMMNAPAARVITVASGSHASAATEHGWYQQRATYDRRRAYANSKLANIMFAY